MLIDWAGEMFNSSYPIFLPYALGSVGNPNNNFTAGCGVLISTVNLNPVVESAVFTIGSKLVLTNTLSIISENWGLWLSYSQTWDNGLIVPALGFRIAGNRFSWDIGALTLVFINDGQWELMEFPLPWLSLSYRVQ